MADTKDNKRSCFIITPIGGNGSAIRRKIDGIIDEVIEPILKEFGFEMFVSHRINDSDTVTNTILRKVYESDLVIANLTGNNPNVMYEVALRHASAKPIIHMTENVDELPFDIKTQRTIPYIDDMAGAHKLKEELRAMMQGIDYSVPVANPITDALVKTKLINIPEDTTKDFADMLLQLQDDMRQLRKEVSTLKVSNKTRAKKEANDKLLFTNLSWAELMDEFENQDVQG